MAAGYGWGGVCYASQDEFLLAWAKSFPWKLSNGTFVGTYGAVASQGAPWREVYFMLDTASGPVLQGTVPVPAIHVNCDTAWNSGTPTDQLLSMSAADAGLIATAIAGAWVVGWVIRRAARIATNRDD